jgi:hypothetical protein
MNRRKSWDPDEIVAGLAGAYLSDPAEAVLHKARALASRLPEPRSGLVRWLVSRLLDSARDPVAVGIRSGLVGERRVLIDLSLKGETTARLELLTLTSDGVTFGLRGQLSPVRDDVTLEIACGARVFELSISPVGDFLINNLPFGKDRAVLRVLALGIEPIEVRDFEPPIERER